MRPLLVLAALLALLLTLRPDDDSTAGPLLSARPPVQGALWTSEELPPLPGALQAQQRPLADHAAFELCGGRQHGDDDVADGAGPWADFEALGGADQRHAGSLQLLYVREDVEHRAAEAVELPDQDVGDPVLVHELHQPGKPWPIVASSR